ncbi:hypothetical protein [Actinophytocola oryzae]|uniref:Uncharacterized protein n=1 Tax=Actinophytocola oryzae TaxID=502181 RepID=A0A4R7VXJ9_9PSEU|nr:hypothetical protein [Actinophytocola oryzae]TDV54860.1 hypothetical protein CLV71_103101 [Actinophytocola oryzae]
MTTARKSYEAGGGGVLSATRAALDAAGIAADRSEHCRIHSESAGRAAELHRTRLSNLC